MYVLNWLVHASEYERGKSVEEKTDVNPLKRKEFPIHVLRFHFIAFQFFFLLIVIDNDEALYTAQNVGFCFILF